MQCSKHGFNLWVKKSPEERNENSMVREVWWATVHGVAESDVTEQLTYTHTILKLHKNKDINGIYFVSTLIHNS